MPDDTYISGRVTLELDRKTARALARHLGKRLADFDGQDLADWASDLVGEEIDRISHQGEHRKGYA